jgi:hypothetical protein
VFKKKITKWYNVGVVKKITKWENVGVVKKITKWENHPRLAKLQNELMLGVLAEVTLGPIWWPSHPNLQFFFLKKKKKKRKKEKHLQLD